MIKKTYRKMKQGYKANGGWMGAQSLDTAMSAAELLYDMGCTARSAGRVAAAKMRDEKNWENIVTLSHSCNKRYLIARGAGTEDVEDIITMLNNGADHISILRHLQVGK